MYGAIARNFKTEESINCKSHQKSLVCFSLTQQHLFFFTKRQSERGGREGVMGMAQRLLPKCASVHVNLKTTSSKHFGRQMNESKVVLVTFWVCVYG